MLMGPKHNRSCTQTHTQEHPFSSSSNYHLTWQRSISFCTCAPSPKCLDGSAPHVRRSHHHNLMEINPGVKIKRAFSMTYCTPNVHTNPPDLVQVLWNLQFWNFPENHLKPFQRTAMLLSPCHLTMLQTAGLKKVSDLRTNKHTFYILKNEPGEFST